MLSDIAISIENRMTLQTESPINTSISNGPTTSSAVASSAADKASTLKSISLSFDSSQLSLENIIPGIYLTKHFIAWSNEKLHSHGFTHIITIDRHIHELYYPSLDPSYNNNHLCDEKFSQQLFDEYFDKIDLNFGEKVYLTKVLPNCYKSVKFIDRALSGGGTIIVMDCNVGEQKCLTIIAAYLMYKNNYSFSDAFSRLKVFYKKADLDRFYISQLYEYEPILQVHRAQSRGQSCSRELHSAILKRKKLHDDQNELTHPISLTHFNNNFYDDIAMQ